MNNLNNDNLNILDLPDEILFIIFKKPNTIDVFHLLVGVNQQFDRLALDPLNVRDLDMTDIMIINSLYDKTPSIDTETLSKICSKILPRIHRQVHKLTVEQYSMKDILLAANYSELYSLSLINFQAKILYQYLRGDLILRDLLTKQIMHLNIDIKRTTKRFSMTVSKIFELIVSLCKNLTVLNFCDMFHTRTYETSVFYRSSNYMSSTLIKLKIHVLSLDDCLYLLDGRLDSLSTLIINVEHIFDPKKLPKLKYLSFTTSNDSWQYDNLIVPLLCRMINLEELKLFLLIKRFNSIYVDGIQLYNQFLIYMTQLKKFTFCINTEVYNEVTVELPSNEDIQRSFIGRGYQQVTSYVHTNSKIISQCLIYSLPYDFEYFVKINNSFQGGMFDKVRQLKMSDGIPFEHKFFQLISKDFPFLQFLNIYNYHPQNYKTHSSTLITFPYLTFLDLRRAHVHYVKLFLLKNNAYLPRLSNLGIRYKSLTTITKNFTKDALDFNFGTLKSLDVCRSFIRPKNFHQYFPLLLVINKRKYFF
ncbi:unnamed protein product [Rotaria sp. Silwood2]|nr:unnamed protein product [Rotaria sp. Silwood2]